jgi:RNA recognition motif-containing protein
MKVVTNDTLATATIEFETADDVLAAQTRDQKILDGHTISVRVGVETTLWITNFQSAADEEYIRTIFAPFGEIVDIRFPSLSVNNKRRFCYLQYKRQEEAHAAQQALDDSPAPSISSSDAEHTTKARKLIVKISDPSQKHHRQGAVYEGRELFIRNIPISMKEPDIRKMFEKYGPLERVHLPSKDELFHTHQGFGFLSFENVEDAKKALELDLTKAGDRVLSVTVAEARSGAGGRGGRGGFGGPGRGRGRGRGGSDGANRADHRARRI